ncbi:MAG TPA: serine/threonine-protein kinase, partial [Nannocystaceae bacterium]|nr:serine/threonine-protein kinase [Nannocystaceae bacterium]
MTARPQTHPSPSDAPASSPQRTEVMREDSDGYDTLGDDDAHDTIPDGTLVAGGRLRVGEWIARGAMATVYQAIEVASGRKVALKVLGGKYADLPDAEPRLFAEAKYAAKLGNHPNIVEPLYWGNLDEWHGRAYLVSEIVEGPTLKGYLLGHEVSTAAICELLRDVAAVLADVHGLGIIHRDVKPSNVLVAEEDGVLIPKLTDFGLATTLDRLEPSLADARLTQEFERLGTKHYMAPEQCLGLPLTMACDVYALGVTAFECFVGSPPWGGRAEVEVVQRKCDATQPSFSLARMQLGLPERLATIVDAALAFDPAARPSAREFHDELAAVVRALQRGDAGFVDVPTRELVRRASERVDV